MSLSTGERCLYPITLQDTVWTPEVQLLECLIAMSQTGQQWWGQGSPYMTGGQEVPTKKPEHRIPRGDQPGVYLVICTPRKNSVICESWGLRWCRWKRSQRMLINVTVRLFICLRCPAWENLGLLNIFIYMDMYNSFFLGKNLRFHLE